MDAHEYIERRLEVVGWSVAEETMRLTPESALPMCILFFLAMVFGVAFLGFMVRWMAVSYGTQTDFAHGVALISYTASPFFLAGVLGLAQNLPRPPATFPKVSATPQSLLAEARRPKRPPKRPKTVFLSQHGPMLAPTWSHVRTKITFRKYLMPKQPES